MELDGLDGVPYVCVTQRDSPPSDPPGPSDEMFVFDYKAKLFWRWTGCEWVRLGSDNK